VNDEVEPRMIKKYPNRRLYDTEQGRYITRGILLQIIFEQESETNPLFSNDNLERFIRFYNAGTHMGFSEFIGQGMNFSSSNSAILARRRKA